MLWPISVSQVIKLPELPSPKPGSQQASYKPHPHLDPIRQVCQNKRNNPFVAITYRSIFLFNYKTNAAIGAHVRSEESLEALGENVHVERSQDGSKFVVETGKNFLLIYTISTNPENSNGTSLEETLTVFGESQNKMLQNGYILDLDDTKNVQSYFSSIFGNNVPMFPNHDHTLRIRLVLKIQSKLLDYFLLDKQRLIIFTKEPHAIQIVNLGETKEDGKHIEVHQFDDLEWYSDKEALVKKCVFNPALGLFLIINDKNECWLCLLKEGPQFEIQGQKIVLNTDSEIIDAVINEYYSLLTVATRDGQLFIYKLAHGGIQLVRRVKKHIHSDDLISINPVGSEKQCVLALFEKGWNLYSRLGNLNFSTFDYDNLSSVPDINWCSSLVDGQYSHNQELIFASKHRLFVVELAALNHSRNYNSINFRRPLIVRKDTVSVFKGYDKALIDYHSNFEDMDFSKDTNLWINLELPERFKLTNLDIVASSVNDDGNCLCIVGDSNTIVHNLTKNRWKELIGLNYNPVTESGKNLVVNCLWWQGFLFLAVANYRQDQLVSEIVVYSPNIFNNDEYCDDHIVWRFNLNETKVGEQFLLFDIDTFTDELIVLTTQLNCYCWKISHEANKITIKRTRAYQLKDSFVNLANMFHIKCISRVGEDDLLMLVKGSLYYIKKAAGRSKTIYQRFTLLENVEYYQRPSADILLAFNGHKTLYYDIAHGRDLNDLEPVSIQWQSMGGNERDDEVEANATMPYPIVAIPEKRLILGLEVDISRIGVVDVQDTVDESMQVIKLSTVKKNYLVNLVDYYVMLAVQLGDADKGSLEEVYKNFHRYKHFNFCLELLLLNHIVDGKQSDDNEDITDLVIKDRYFQKLNELIALTKFKHSIYLNFLKKVENQNWIRFFDKVGETPRDMLQEILDDKNYKLAAHFLIVVMNFEKEDDSVISLQDQEILLEILNKLVIYKDYGTSFELLRFIKIVDDKLCDSITKKLLVKDK
ncbi:unnamed protein product [Kuraishia capsulata CBS 1993]|uniref:RIC1 C-terminal alpha solenoid region domain-containing protein n=1 Tax=Kuraishia capsulata CBS 1993 TaxID=1382522 RepID=W6MXD2_9ASCO|nr:uncharacterized protein KUCA_T00004669001 [Kuraishia capsulata CBS 1993]CDK28685.1 unnamed protein product [Kuraishia capsulata CBS 1993]